MTRSGPAAIMPFVDTTGLVILMAFLVLGPAFWMAVMALIAWLGGWRKLAQKHPQRRPIDGRRFRFLGGQVVGGVLPHANYNGCLTLTLAREGPSVEVWLPFRFGHGPLQFEWSQAGIETRKVLGLFERTTLDLGDDPQLRIPLGGRQKEKLAAALRELWPEASR